jgi:hypothetical protein
MRLARLLYFSLRVDLGPTVLDDVLAISRLNNLRDGITGALISSDRHFVQLLEGDRIAVRRCFKRIMRDPRHRDLQVVTALAADQRLFGSWSMHAVEVSGVRTNILDRYLVGGAFEPPQIPHFVLEHLCLTLSADEWQREAA